MGRALFSPQHSLGLSSSLGHGDRNVFHVVDAALIRAAAYPDDLTLPAWPDLTIQDPERWLRWLGQAWALPGFAHAVMAAAPQYSAQVARALAGEPMRPRRLARLVETAIRYLLRWTTRATPFGTFAGIAPLKVGARAVVSWGGQHRVVTRADDAFVAEHTRRVEGELAVLRTAAVVTNAVGYRRGRMWVLPFARTGGDRMWDVEVALSDPVRLAVDTARTPIVFTDLAATVAAKLGAEAGTVERLLAALVHAGVLLSQIRPPMTCTDPAAYLAAHTELLDPGPQVMTDLRVDCSVTIPQAVAAEACRAAEALVSVAPHLPGWGTYHRDFVERWGPGAAVPLRDVLDALGFPAGYRGSHRREVEAFTRRDRLLADLAQTCALDGHQEVLLDDELISRLREGDDRPPIPHTELRFCLAAQTPGDLDRGDFTLTVVSGARHAAVAAARFLHLLTPAELARFTRAYASLPTALPGAETVQLSAPPLAERLTSLSRTPGLLPVLPVGDFHPRSALTIADLAVAADARRLCLVSATTGRPVEPLLATCVKLPDLQQPLARFLAEIWAAWSAPCGRFDWGQAASLPFLPRIRRGRSILAPARWIISATALPAAGASWPEWMQAWDHHRDRRHLPRQVLLGHDDVRLCLDVEENAHLAVLRSHLDRHGRAVLTEAPGPAGWLGGRPAELLLTLAHTPPAHTASGYRTGPRVARPAVALQHRPGAGEWLDARLYGDPGRILVHLADQLAARSGAPGGELPDGWWFIRYPDPGPHLRLRVPLHTGVRTISFTDAARDLAGLADDLHNEGLLTDYSLATYRPETRHGIGPTLTAAHQVFAADSRAALHHLSGDRQAATAAGMIAIADGFTGDGLAWLAAHIPHRSGPRLDPAQLAAARRPYGGTNLTQALAAYRALADRDGLGPDQVLAGLLHLHHARMIGVDIASEQHCARLARSIARTGLARTGASGRTP